MASDIHHIMLRPSNKARASDYDCTEETVKVVWQCDKSASAHVSEINLMNIDSLHSICVCVCVMDSENSAALRMPRRISYDFKAEI